MRRAQAFFEHLDRPQDAKDAGDRAENAASWQRGTRSEEGRVI